MKPRVIETMSEIFPNEENVVLKAVKNYYNAGHPANRRPTEKKINYRESKFVPKELQELYDNPVNATIPDTVEKLILIQEGKALSSTAKRDLEDYLQLGIISFKTNLITGEKTYLPERIFVYAVSIPEEKQEEDNLESRFNLN